MEREARGGRREGLVNQRLDNLGARHRGHRRNRADSAGRLREQEVLVAGGRARWRALVLRDVRRRMAQPVQRRGLLPDEEGEREPEGEAEGAESLHVSAILLEAKDALTFQHGKAVALHEFLPEPSIVALDEIILAAIDAAIAESEWDVADKLLGAMEALCRDNERDARLAAAYMRIARHF